MAATPVADLFVRVRATFDDLKKVGSQVEAALAPARQSLRRVGTALSASVTLPLLAVGKQALDTAARFDTLERGLTAIVGSSEEAQKQITRLKEIAKAPGINFEQALAGSRNLQVVGFSAEFAEEAIKQLGNAVALAGGSADDLSEITRQLQQVKGLGKITAENFNVIAERAPVVRTALENAFQTTSIEELRKRGVGVDQFIQGIIQGLQGIPRATGGIANDLQNLRSDITEIFAEIGKAIIPIAKAFIERVSPAIRAATKFIAGLDERIKLAIVSFAGLLAVIGPISVALYALLTPIGLTVAAIAGLGAIAVSLVKDWQPVVKRFFEIFETIKFHAVTQFSEIALNILATVEIISRAINLLGQAPGITQVFKALEIASETLLKAVKLTIEAIVKAFSIIPGVQQLADKLSEAGVGSSEFTKQIDKLTTRLLDLQDQAKANYDSGLASANKRAGELTGSIKSAIDVAKELKGIVLGGSNPFNVGGPDGPGDKPPAPSLALPSLQGVVTNPLEPLNNALPDTTERLREVGEIVTQSTEQINALGAVASLAFDGIAAGIDNAVDKLLFVNGKFLELKNIGAALGETFRTVFQNLIKDLVAATIKAVALKAIMAAFGIGGVPSFGGVFSAVLVGGGLGSFLGGGRNETRVGTGTLPRLSVQQTVVPNGVVQTINERASLQTLRNFGG